MKKLLLFAILLVTSLGVGAQCTYTLSLYDSFGDGWNGSETAPSIPDVDIIVNGTVVNTVTMVGGSGPDIYNIIVNSGDIITLDYEVNGANYAAENGILLIDADNNIAYTSGMNAGNTAALGGSTPADLVAPGVTVVCPSCAAPSGLTSVVTLPSTVDLSWIASGTATDYSVYYRVVGAGAWTGAPGNPIAGLTVNITGLTASTNYEYQIASNCPGPAISDSVSGTFNTLVFPGTCAGAIPIGFGSYTAPGPSTGGGASNNCLAGATNANWYAYTATTTGTALITSDLPANAGGDTRLSVYTGDCVTGLTCYADNDDVGFPNFLSELTMDICAGTTYYIEWDDRWEDLPFDFQIIETAVCDDPSTATLTPTLDGLDATSTWTAGGGSCGGGFEWAVVADGGTPNYTTDLANGTGTYPVSIPAVTGLSDGTDYDFYVRDVCGANFSNEILTNFTTVAACAAPGGLTAVVTLPSTVDISWTSSGVGNTYTLEYRVVGAGAWTAAPGNPYAGTTANITGLSTDDFEFRIASNCPGPVTSGLASGTFTTIPFPGTCADAIAITAGAYTAPGPSTGGGASNNCFGGGATNANWYAYTASVNGLATITSDLPANAGLDTRLSIYTGDCVTGLTCFAGNDDIDPFFGPLTSEILFDVCAGSTYYIEWDDRWDDLAFDFEITELAVCAEPFNLTAGLATLDGILSVNWVAGTGQCGGGYEWEVVADGDAPFAGNDIQSASGVYPLIPFDISGLASGTTYDFYVRDDCGGSFSINLAGFFTTLAPPPANDEISGAVAVSCGSVTSGTTLNATQGADELGGFCGTTPAAEGVWYSFAGNGDDVTVSLCSGTAYDSKINVYTGTSGSLTCVGGNDDFCGAQSEFTFTSVLGTNYLILVNGFGGNQGDFDLTVTCVTPPPPGAITWNGSVDDDWTNAANWTGGVPPFGCADNIFIPDVATQPSVAASQDVGELTLASNASVTVQAAGSLNVCGDVTLGSGSIADGDGAINLLGTGTGTSIVSVTDATVSNLVAQANYSLASGTMNITNSLTLDGGDFTNLGGDVVLVSNVAGTAYFDDFSNPGNTYIGNLSVQRFVTNGFAGGLGQRYFGSAVDGGAVTGLDGTYASGYPTGQIQPDACNPNLLLAGSPYSNLFEWNEVGPYPTTCEQEGWFAIAATAGLTNGRGYSGWMNNGSTLEVSGTPNTAPTAGDISYGALDATAPVALTNARGWHLLSNPFPSPMNIDAVTADGFTSPQYYNAASGAFSGTFQPALVAGAEVPIMQGFVAQTAGPNTFTPSNAERIASNNPNFAKSTAWYDFMFEVEVEVNGNKDVTYLYYSGNSTAQFDNTTDCIKRHSDLTKPTLFTKLGADELSLNGLHLNDLGTSIPMGLVAPELGTYTFNFTGMNDFPANTTIYIEDVMTGIYHNVADGAYTFNADPADNGSDRFMIHFVLPASFNLVEPSCENVEGTVIENTTDGRNISIMSDGVEVATGILDGSSNSLANGNYTIEVYDQYGGSQSYDFVIEEYVAVEALIIASQTAIEEGEAINFDFAGNGANNYEWYVDGQLIAQTELFTFTFTTAGEYIVEVFGSNENCEAIASQTITVSEKTTSIVNIGENGTLNIFESNGDVVLNFTNVNKGTIVANLYNMLGQRVASKEIDTNGKQFIQNNNWADGVYILKLKIDNVSVSETLMLTK